MPDTFTSDDIAQTDPSAAGASSARQTQTEVAADAAPRQQPSSSERDTQSAPGAIPFADHQRVVDGFHERLDAVHWAHGLDSARVQEALRLADLYERNPGELYRSLGPRVEQATAPEADVRDERGEAFYSPKQAAALAQHLVKEAIEEMRAENDARLTPLERRTADADRTDQLVEQIQDATAWPGFNEHIDAITAAVAAGNRGHGPKLSLKDAYIHVVVPKLAISRQALETELRTAIVAETNGATRRDDIHPGRSPSAGHVKDSDKSLTDLFREEYARAARSA